MDIAATRTDILRSTRGRLVYMEQVMELAMQIGGMDLAFADHVRKLVAKRNLSQLEEYRSVFVEGAVKAGGDAAQADALFNELTQATNLRNRAGESISQVLGQPE